MRMRRMLTLLCLGGTLLAGCGTAGGSRGNNQGFGATDDFWRLSRRAEPAAVGGPIGRSGPGMDQPLYDRRTVLQP
jgi:hypothetical protein